MDAGVLREAFRTLLSDSSTPSVRQGAQQYLDSLAAQDKAPEFCWELFLSLSAGTIDVESHDIRFWTLQVVCKAIGSLEVNARAALNQALWTDYMEKRFPALSDEVPYVFNKLLAMQVSLIAVDYPDRCPQAFTRYISKIESEPAEMKPRWIHAFLELLQILDAEVIADEISSRTDEERVVAMRIKDGMRMGDIVSILQLLDRIVTGSLFNLEAEVAKAIETTDTAALPAWWFSLASSSLKVYAKVAAWVDTVLLVSENGKMLQFTFVAMLNKLGLQLTEAALEALQALVYKKMDGGQKTLLLKRYNLVERFIESMRQVKKAKLKQASVMNVLCCQLVDAMTDLQAFLAAKIRPNAYRLEMSSDEALRTLEELSSLLEAVLYEAVNGFLLSPEFTAHNEESLYSQLRVTEAVLPALHEVLRLIRTLWTKQSNALQISPVMKDVLLRSLTGSLNFVRIPDLFDWTVLFEESEACFNADEDDGSPLSEYLVCRKGVIHFFRKIYALAILEPAGIIATEFVKHLASQTSDLRFAEAAITILTASLDVFKENSTQASSVALLDQCFGAYMVFIPIARQPQCPPLVRSCLMEGLGRISLFLKQDAHRRNDDFTIAGLALLLSEHGLRSNDSRRVVAVAVRELMRFSRAVVFRIPEAVLMNHVAALQSEQFLDIDPVSEDLIPREEYWEEYGGGKWTSNVYTLKHPNLSIEDQTRIFEWIGALPIEATAKNAALQHITEPLLQQLRGAMVTHVPHQKGSITEWVSRSLRSIANLFKGYTDTLECRKFIAGVLSVLCVVAEQMAEVTKVHRNILIILRRFVLSCPPEETVDGMRQLIVTLHEKMLLCVKHAVAVGDQEKRIAPHLANLSNFMSTFCINTWSTTNIQKVYFAQFQNRFLIEWTVMKILEAWRTLFSKCLDDATAQASLLEVLAVIPNFFCKATVAAAWLVTVEQFVKGKALTKEVATLDELKDGSLASLFEYMAAGTLVAPETEGLTLYLAACVQSEAVVITTLCTTPEVVRSFHVYMLELYPSLVEPLSGLSGLGAAGSDEWVASYLNTDGLKLCQILRICAGAVAGRSVNDPNVGRVLQEVGVLMKFLWSGKFFGKNLVCQHTQALRLLQKATAAVYLPTDTVKEALARADSPKECRDLMLSQFQSLHAAAPR